MERSKSKPIDPELLTPAAIARFRRKYLVDLTSGCWVWQGSTAVSGYGRFGIGGRCPVAHRVSWVIAHGVDIPPSKVLDHLCRNRACVNPAHLDVVDDAENVARGTGNMATTMRLLRSGVLRCQRGHDLSRPEAWLTNASTGKRGCIECQRKMNREAARRRYARQKRAAAETGLQG